MCLWIMIIAFWFLLMLCCPLLNWQQLPQRIYKRIDIILGVVALHGNAYEFLFLPGIQGDFDLEFVI